MLPTAVTGLSLFEQNIPLAIFIEVMASIFFATGATIQHVAVSRIVGEDDLDERSMTVGQLGKMLTLPLWWFGLIIVGIGAVGHIVGLMMAPVVVLQPVGILAVPWSVLMSAKINRFRPNQVIWSAVGMTIVGITVFTLLSATHATISTDVSATVRIVVGCVVVMFFAAIFGIIGAKGPVKLRSLAWAVGGSFLYGLSVTLVKITTELLKLDNFHTLPILWVVAPIMLLCYLAGGIYIQQGYANGPAEIVVGCMTTIDPIVAVTYSLIILGEGALITPLAAVGMTFAGALAVLGVVLLSRYHPDAIARREAIDATESWSALDQQG